MDFVVYLALGVLIVVFAVSLVILIVMCRRRAVQLKYLNFSPSQRFSKLQNLESIEGIAQLSPMIAAALDKNSWVYDVSGLLQHCVALLRLCHSLSEKLSKIPLQASIRQHPPLNTVLCEATHRVLPAFDDLLNSVASPNVDVRVLEARATSLATICWGLCLPFVLINPKVHEALGNPLSEMDTHLVILRQAAEMAEKAEMGKLQMDWNALAEEEDKGEHEESEETETKIETTPLVDKNATVSDSKEENMSLLQEIAEAIENKRAEEIRNVCLIAHVDHGKTSLADSLVSANAIISNRMAGKLRFMDSREDEQTRGITMKSSGVSLLCGPLLVNLMDSPGHVDFSSEVTSALLVSDMAFLLVDAVEGVCSQTQALLRQAIVNGQSLILVINKLDRLCVELKMSSSEAYQHLARLLEAVNSCVSQVVAGMVLEEDSFNAIEKMESRLHFEPVKGNVLFSSAIHGYAFAVEDFADVYADKLKIDKKSLIEGLFGDFYIHVGSVKEGAFAKGKRPLFEQLILDPLWALHECGLVKPDIAKLLQLADEAFDEVMRQWMPVARACFRTAARQPSAKVAFQSEQRLSLLLGSSDHILYDPIKKCSPDGETVLAVVKFIQHEGEKVAICRVLSGKVKREDVLYISGGKKIPEDEDIPSTVVEKVLMLRGRDCLSVKGATAGTICAISAKNLIQNATLCSKPVREGLELGREVGEPLVRVSVNTAELDQMDELRRTLKLLTVLDPSLRILELETGELAMVTAGEVHLQKCLKDLEDMGMSGLEVSPPIVPFLETVVPDPVATSMEIVEKVTECRIRGETLFLRLRVAPLPLEIVSMLEKSTEELLDLKRGQMGTVKIEQLRQKLREQFAELLPHMKGTWWYKMAKEDVGTFVDKIWCFGPDKARANILINSIPDYDRGSVWQKSASALRPFDHSLVSGFQLFVGSGPLCNETMRGVVVFVEGWTVDDKDPVIGGQMISAMKATCKAATEKLGTLRLVAAMYKCIITTASQSLGKVHSVLSQRKAKVLREDSNEVTGLFEVEALLPVVESFSFCDHLRKNTSGMASAQLEFSHWQIIDEDPYWQPSTLEEIEEYGLKGDSPNHARGYMDAVRRRKGLPTEDLIVISADKQRTLNKKK